MNNAWLQALIDLQNKIGHVPIILGSKDGNWKCPLCVGTMYRVFIYQHKGCIWHSWLYHLVAIHEYTPPDYFVNMVAFEGCFGPRKEK